MGNPVKYPRIAPQENSGINGGRFGLTRSCSGGVCSQFHYGLDVANEVGDPFYAMYSGQVVSVNNVEHKDLGYYVTIQVEIGGSYYLISYGHLEKSGRPLNGSSINVGNIIGNQGLSGNLGEAIFEGWTNQPHTHLQMRKKLPNNDWVLETGFGEFINPEPLITTQFDNQGNVVSETDC